MPLDPVGSQVPQAHVLALGKRAVFGVPVPVEEQPLAAIQHAKQGRNVVNVSNCDAVIIIGGHVGTLNEFTIAYDEGMVVGIMQGSGGIADFIDDIIKIASKKTGATVIYEKDPHELVRKVIVEISRRDKKNGLLKNKGKNHVCERC